MFFFNEIEKNEKQVLLEDEIIQIGERFENNLKFDHECTTPIYIFGVQNCSPIAWTLEGKHFAYVGENCSIFINSFENGRFETERTLDGHNRRLTSILFHPTLPILVSAGIEGIYVWDW